MEPDRFEAGQLVKATVFTTSGRTTYHRTGQGRPVLLLADGGGSATTESRLFRGLSASFRVVAPDSPEDAAQQASSFVFSQWIRDVIDGLGLANPGIVATERFGVATLGFALSDPDRTGPLVILSGEPISADGDSAAEPNVSEDDARFGNAAEPDRRCEAPSAWHLAAFESSEPCSRPDGSLRRPTQIEMPAGYVTCTRPRVLLVRLGTASAGVLETGPKLLERISRHLAEDFAGVGSRSK